MATRQEELYIGIDLSDTWAQISYLGADRKEPETVSVVAGEERYRIPTALYRKEEHAPWYLLGAEELEYRECLESDGFCVRDLWNRSLQGEKVLLEREYEVKELFLLYLRKVLRLVPGLSDFSQIQALTFHLEEIDLQRTVFLRELLEQAGIPGSRIFLQDSKESFCHFVMHQQKELIQHKVALFQCREHQLMGYLLTRQTKTSPNKVELQALDLGTLPEQPEDRDFVFAKKAGAFLSGKIVSVVYLTGDGLEGGWMQESIEVLCRGRRAFQGKNLYTRGACYGSYMQTHKQEAGYVYFSEYIWKDNVFLQVKQGERTFFKELAEAGTGCYEVNGSCEVLLSGEPSVDIWVQPADSREARVESLQLTELPKRPPKATRLKIEALAAGKGQILIRITDLGFGTWYVSSKKVWEYYIDE